MTVFNQRNFKIFLAILISMWYILKRVASMCTRALTKQTHILHKVCMSSICFFDSGKCNIDCHDQCLNKETAGWSTWPDYFPD